MAKSKLLKHTVAFMCVGMEMSHVKSSPFSLTNYFM